MSSDPQILQAFARRCGSKLHYSDLVNIQFEEGEDERKALGDGSPTPPTEGPKFGATKKVYLCVGPSQLCLLASSMSRRLQLFDGRIDYAWIEKVVVDSSSRTKFLVVLSAAKVRSAMSFYKGGTQFIVDSDDRDELLKLISIHFVADGLHRTQKLQSLLRVHHDLGTSPAPSSIAPPAGYKKASFRGYSFFIRRDFQDVPNAVTKATGHFSIPAAKLLENRSFFWSRGGEVELLVSVVDPLPLSSLQPLGREHVRWVAVECKQPLLKSWNTRVVHNRPYAKRMNLANDIASWSCWEMYIEDDDFTWAMVVLRRQYVPPVLDTVQDFILALKCKSDADPGSKKNMEACLMRELNFIADSFSPQPHPNPNLDMVQAKLDALLFDDDAYRWLYDRFKLVPLGQLNIDKYCTIFIKGVVKTLYNEHMLNSLDVVDDMEKKTDAVCKSMAEADLEPLVIMLRVLAHPGEGLPRTNPNPESMHAWQARVASYFAGQLDGGMLGSRLSLAMIAEAVHNGRVPQETKAVFENILAAVLHLRPLDLRVPWELKVVQAQMLGMGLLSPPEGRSDEAVHCSFNDRVMQVLLETGHLRAVLEDEDDGKGCMSMQYSRLLANLLTCGSTNLKACVCRLIIADQAVGEKGQSIVLANGLAELMRTGSTFLMTYASAAMVNLTQTHEVARSHLIHEDLVPILRNVRLKDSDLMLYTLMLVVQLTKRSNHRAALEKIGILQFCFEVLEAIHTQLSYRWRVIAELCFVLGQLFCDESAVAAAAQPGCKVAACLLFALEESLALPGPEGIKTATKVLFALENLTHEELRKQIAESSALKKLLQAVSQKDYTSHVDFANHAVMLFSLLSSGRKACQQMHYYGWEKCYQVLLDSEIGKEDAVRERIVAIQNSITSFQ